MSLAPLEEMEMLGVVFDGLTGFTIKTFFYTGVDANII